MKYFLVFIATFVIGGKAFAQDSVSFHIEYRLSSLKFQKDKLVPADTIPITADITSLSEILPLGKSQNGNRYGIQFEIMESKIAYQSDYFLRFCYFIEKNGKWEAITRTYLVDLDVGRDNYIPGKTRIAFHDRHGYGKKIFMAEYSIAILMK